MRRAWRAAGCLMAVGVSGCAVPRPVIAVAPMPAPPPLHGAIVAIRPSGGEAMATSILAAVGGSGGVADAREVEVIVRAEDGRTVSVMREDAAGLFVGEMVVLTPAVPTRISAGGS